MSYAMSGTEREQFVAQHNTAYGSHSLKVMTVVVVILLPLVLAYQAWTYHVFRRPISRSEFLSRQPATQTRAARRRHPKPPRRLPATEPDGKRRPHR